MRREMLRDESTMSVLRGRGKSKKHAKECETMAKGDEVLKLPRQ